MSFLLSLALLSDPRASTVDVSGGAIAEVRGGRAPVNPALPPEPSVLTVLTPIARLQFASRAHQGGGVLSYSPRVLFRYPNLAELTRPLLLHDARFAYGRAWTERWRTDFNARAAVGQIDYTTAQSLFGEQQGVLPSATVTNYLLSGAGFSLVGRVHPNHTIVIQPDFDFRTPILESTEQPTDPNMLALTTVLPRQIGGSLALGHVQMLTPVDSLLTQVGVQYVDFAERGASYIVSATYGWGRQITRTLASTVRAGAFATQSTRVPEGITRVAANTPVVPLIVADLTGRLYSRANLRITGNFGLSTGAFLDSISGEVLPRAGANAGLLFQLPPRWSVGVIASMFTSATLEPRDFTQEGGATDPALQQETVISWRTPITYAFRRSYALEFGTIWSVRAPHLASPDFRLRQLESWAYVAFSFDFTTARQSRREGAGAGATPIGGGAAQ